MNVDIFIHRSTHIDSRYKSLYKIGYKQHDDDKGVRRKNSFGKQTTTGGKNAFFRCWYVGCFCHLPFPFEMKTADEKKVLETNWILLSYPLSTVSSSRSRMIYETIIHLNRATRSSPHKLMRKLVLLISFQFKKKSSRKSLRPKRGGWKCEAIRPQEVSIHRFFFRRRKERFHVCRENWGQV